MDITILYAAIGVAAVGMIAISAAPRIMRSLLTPSAGARREVYVQSARRP